MHKHNVIFNKTVTKFVTILTKCYFFYIWTLQATLILKIRLLVTWLKCLEINNKNTRPLLFWRHSGVFVVIFGHISCLFLEFLWLTLNVYLFAGYRSFCYKRVCLLFASVIPKNHFEKLLKIYRETLMSHSLLDKLVDMQL